MTLQESPNCEFLLKERRCCLWLSGNIGRTISVTPLFCNTICKKNGRYCGQKPNNPELVTLEAWWRLWGGNTDFLKRVYKHYSMEATIRIPKEWDSVKNSLDFLKGNPNFRGILLTGSIVLDVKRPLKDYDIALWYKDTKIMIEQEDEIKKDLPKEIDNTRVDYWFLSGEYPDPFFITLDVEKMVLYTSSWFNLKIKKVQEGIKVVQQPVTGLQEMLRKRLC